MYYTVLLMYYNVLYNICMKGDTAMAQSTISVRVNNEDKKLFIAKFKNRILN